jgi:hypothetical protein
MTDNKPMNHALKLAEVLEKCRTQFGFYAEQHAAKHTPEADAKAKVNAQMVDMCTEALTAYRASETASTPPSRPQGEEGLDRDELTDLISDAISDSMDMDWSYRDGARAVVAALIEEGIVKNGPQALAEAEGAQQNETDGAHEAALSNQGKPSS